MTFCRPLPTRNPHLTTLCVLLLGVMLQCVSPRPAEADDDAVRLAFTRSIKPFLTEHCHRCHGAGKQEADLRVDNLDPNIVSGPDVDTWNTIRFKLVAEEMPPSEEPRPPRVAQRRVVRWLTQQLHEAGVTLQEPDEFYLPKHGNKVDHELLFSGRVKGPASTPARIWRMGPNAYETMMKGELAKNARGVAQPFGGLTEPGIKDYAAAFSIDEPTAGQLLRNAQAIVGSQTRGELQDGKFVSKGYPQPIKEMVALFQPKNQPPSVELKNKAITRQFQLVLNREPTDDELARYRSLLDRNIKDAGLVMGVRTTMAAVLLTPEAVYRFELGAGEADEHGRRMLAPRELAYAIAFALTDKRPDSTLLRAAAENRLSTREDVAREVERLFQDPKASKTRVMRFFREYFGYQQAVEVFKDKSLNPNHRADVLVSDTELLIQWILDRDQDVLVELLTTNKSFVNYFQDKKSTRPRQPKSLVHTSYGLPIDWKWTPYQPVELPRSERAGILTQPSWLVANSGNFDNHPILRGKWIRERLLGGTIPDLPITVDAQLPEEPHNTLRQRMRVTREAYCWNCHQRMNPLGLTFEAFDHFGRFRTFEPVVDVEKTKANVDKKGKPLGSIYARRPADASGRIENSGDEQLDGEYEDAVGMIHALAKSERVRQVFIRHAFRYWLGRNEQLIDSPTLIAADRAYTESGGSFRTLVTALLTSDSFLYRTDGEAAEDLGSPEN